MKKNTYSDIKNKGKKALIIGMVTVLTASMFAGCGQVAKEKPEEPKVKEAVVNEKVESGAEVKTGLRDIAFEKEKNADIEKVFKTKLDLDDEAFKATRYEYSYVDLNNDGKDEAFVLLMGMYTSGSGGATAMIMEKNDKDEWAAKQNLTLINTPVIVSDEVNEGWRKIITYKSGGGAEGSYVVLNPVEGKYQSVNDGAKLDSIEGINGDEILSGLFED